MRQLLTVCFQPPYHIPARGDGNLRAALDKQRTKGERRNIILLLEDRDASLLDLKTLGFDALAQ